MTYKQRLAAAAGSILLLAAGLCLWWQAPGRAPSAGAPGAAEGQPPRAAGAGLPATPGAPAPRAPEVAALSLAEPPSPIAEALGSPATSIHQDLRLLQEVLHAWQTNFSAAGFPEGENAEITAALTGRNPLRFAFIRPGHPAINARGELCDRWGTPFFFHSLARDRMELRSAGPDRQLYTDDDALLTPE